MLRNILMKLFGAVGGQISISRLLGLLTAERALQRTTILLRQLMMRFTVVLVCTIFSTFLFCVLFAGILYFAHEMLIESGLSSHAALLVIGSVLLLLMIITILVIISQFQKMRYVPRQIVRQQSPFSDKVHDVMGAFMEGWEGRKSKRSRY